MASSIPLAVVLAVLAGSVAAIILEAAGEADLLSRLFAHAVGACITLVLGDYGFPSRALHAEPVLSYLRQPDQLLFVFATAAAASLIDSAFGRHLLPSFIFHGALFLFGLALLD